jgi:hypothetical protein
MTANVKATLLQRDRFDFDDGTTVEMDLEGTETCRG